ncbi:GNAT family N-acetyltransferase [Patulibacter defluvii]|uniref:GNAT family N-acetyltransferase n=1 Tax=Patulibacter defluvii TaxID=3095358 RepID=UPI002A756FEC|nr:GNAT family N-acetyltransferase [Patulibacter sp. DM4]
MRAAPDAPAELVVRELSDDELETVFDLDEIVFHGKLDQDQRARARRYLEPAYKIGSFDGERLVGVLAALEQTMTVAGRDVACWGLTWVGVLPTHRRRGILTAMIGRLWADALAAGRPLVSLWVAEAAIYGRFGCGPAARALATRITTATPLPLRIAPAEAPLTLLSVDQALPLLGPFHERVVRPRRGGLLVRDERLWRDQVLPAKDEDDDELGPPRVVVLGPLDAPLGYVAYRVKPGEDGPGTVALIELEAVDPAAEAALWRYLAAIDLTTAIDCWSRPLDDPLATMLVDGDRLTVRRRFDTLWLRLVDLPAALAERRVAAAVELVVEVEDRTLPANDGRWRLRAAAGETLRAERSDDPADLALAARDLASLYLGGIAAGELQRAGLVDERTPGAVAALDAALRVERAPLAADPF